MGVEVQKEVTWVGQPKVVGKVYAFRFWSDTKTIEVSDSKINHI
ncbi:hypothetical protein [Methanosarcina siciliae]|nr:hypothetical protein [Methanosarcina siciliae]